MFKARYYKADGKKGKKRALPDVLFDGVVHEGVMHQAVKAYLNNQRQGTASAKARSDVRGGSRKPWRQKGTGRARQGTIRAAQWEGGGRAFPPIPHSWRTRIPKRVRTLARRSALNDRAEGDRVVLVDLPEMEAPKTRDLVGFLGGMELEGKTLILTEGNNRNIYLSSRNLQQVQVMPFGEESVYDLLWANTVVIERAALDAAAEDAEPASKEKAEKTKAASRKKPTSKKKSASKKQKSASKEQKSASKKKDDADEAEAKKDDAEEAEADEAPSDQADDQDSTPEADDEGEEE